MNNIDFSLIRKKSYCGDLPIVEKFCKNEKVLCFIGVYHTHDFIKSGNEVFHLIKENFNSLKPEATLIEGEVSHIDLSKCSIHESVCNLVIAPNERKIGEPYYTAYLSQQCNVPYHGAELNSSEIKDLLSLSQFTYRDYIFFLYLVTLNGRHDLEDRDAIDLAQKHFFEFDDINFDERYHFSDFKSWYRSKQGKEYNRKNIDPMEVAPLYDESVYFSQRLNSVLNYNRNKKLVRTIKDHLESCNKLLVVYGGAHYYQTKDALRSIFS